MIHLYGAAHAVRAFLNDRRAVTAMEYGLIAALVAVAIIGVVGGVGTELKTTFEKISTSLAGANK